MTKRKLDKIDGREPWEVEVARWVVNFNLDPVDARAYVICQWMYKGDFRPLAAALRNGPLDGAVRSILANMIDKDLLAIKRKRGAPMQPELFARDIWVRFLHANRAGKSADAIQQIAKDFNISDELVRAIKRK